MTYTYDEQAVFRFLHRQGWAFRQKGAEVILSACPYCGGGKHRDKDTFSLNLHTGAFQCFRASCGRQGHFVTLCRDFGFTLEEQPESGGVSARSWGASGQSALKSAAGGQGTAQSGGKDFRDIGDMTLPPLGDKAEGYLQKRGISLDTAGRYGLAGSGGLLIFPFFSPAGRLVSVKYRKLDYDKTRDRNKEWFERDTQPILFGMAQCRPGAPLVITEGQLDALALAEAGIPNPVSVPNGALGFTWFGHAQEWMAGFSEIVVFGDWEQGKMTLLDGLMARLPAGVRLRAVREADYRGEKDANAILLRYGPAALCRAVENAGAVLPCGVQDLADVAPVDLRTLGRILTNIPELDRLSGGILFGQLVVLTGKRGNGKSTFLSQLICEALDQAYKVFAYSGELSDFHFRRWIDFQLAGPDNVRPMRTPEGPTVFTVPKETLDRISAWYRGRIFLCTQATEEAGLLRMAEEVILRLGVKLICIDNLMTAMDAAADADLYRAQSRFCGALKQMAVRYDVAVILVAHPRKSREGFTNDDVSGSADITNKADLVLAYERVSGEYDARLSVTKNRLFGAYATGKDAIGLFYSVSTKRISSISRKKTSYGWEK